MNTTWNLEKARTNLVKHGVAFEDAEVALSDPSALTREDPDAQSERRFVTVGSDAIGGVVTVVYIYRDVHVRILSARRATRKEINAYAQRI